jgi:hypothetical protein
MPEHCGRAVRHHQRGALTYLKPLEAEAAESQDEHVTAITRPRADLLEGGVGCQAGAHVGAAGTDG